MMGRVCSASHDVEWTTKRCVGASLLVQLSAGGTIFVNNEQAVKLGSMLRARREELGLSTRRLADKAEVRQPTVTRIEQGKFASPRPDKLAKIASVLGLNLADLYAHAGYFVPDELPSLPVYLAAKYGHLPQSAIEELSKLAGELLERSDEQLSNTPLFSEESSS